MQNRYAARGLRMRWDPRKTYLICLAEPRSRAPKSIRRGHGESCIRGVSALATTMLIELDATSAGTVACVRPTVWHAPCPME